MTRQRAWGRQFWPALLFILAIGSPPSATGDAGHGVTQLPGPARRIVALSPHATELVFAAGAGERLVGVVAYSDYPPAATALPRIGDAARLDRERLLSLAPDLVIAWPSGNRPQDLDWLRRRGLAIFSSDPAMLQDIAEDIRAIGRLAGSSRQARAAAAAFEHRLADLRRIYARRTPLSIFYQVWPGPLFTIGHDHVINRVLALCGGRNLFADLPQPAPQVSREAVLAAAPDVIVAALQGDDDSDPFAIWRPWTSLPVVRGERFVGVPADLLHRATPRILDGAQQLCEALRDFGIEE